MERMDIINHPKRTSGLRIKWRMIMSAKKVIGTGLALAGGYLLANVGLIAFTTFKNVGKIKKNPEANNIMEAYLFQKTEKSINADTEYAYFTNLSGFLDLTVPVPEKGQITIDITSVVGKVNINLPSGVNIKCEGSNHLKYTEEHDADAPVINLAVKDYLTGLTLSFDEE